MNIFFYFVKEISRIFYQGGSLIRRFDDSYACVLLLQVVT